MKAYGSIRFVESIDQVPPKAVFVLRVEPDNSAYLMKYYKGVSSNVYEVVSRFPNLDKKNLEDTLNECRAEMQADPQFANRRIYVETPSWKTEEKWKKIK